MFSKLVRPILYESGWLQSVGLVRNASAAVLSYRKFSLDGSGGTADATPNPNGNQLKGVGRVADNVPLKSDVLIVGGGVMGASTAHWLAARDPKLKITVVERDPTYSKCSTTLSAGGIRQQFSLPENILMSLHSSKFIQEIDCHLSVDGEDPPDVNLNLTGYLTLANAGRNEEMIMENLKMQTELGAELQLLDSQGLAERFPWINLAADDSGLDLGKEITKGVYGMKNEGQFDPWALLKAFRAKAESNGVTFVTGEVNGFHLVDEPRQDIHGEAFQSTNALTVRLNDGTDRLMTFDRAVICAGAFSGQVSRALRIGDPTTRSIRNIACPIEPRKRYIFVFKCPNGPPIGMPLTIDTSGVYCRRERSSDLYIAGLCPHSEADEPPIGDFEVDFSWFEERMWPALAFRFPAFEQIKVTSAWAGYYDFCTWDENAIIGQHPYYANVYWATGFSGHGIQMSPALGRAMSELILDGKYSTIDLSRLGWERILNGQRCVESLII